MSFDLTGLWVLLVLAGFVTLVVLIQKFGGKKKTPPDSSGRGPAS